MFYYLIFLNWTVNDLYLLATTHKYVFYTLILLNFYVYCRHNIVNYDIIAFSLYEWKYYSLLI
jgi:hypothetical protein